MIEELSSTWATIKARCEEEISVGLARLEARGRSELDAEFERGRMAALRSILALAAPTKPPRTVKADPFSGY